MARPIAFLVVAACLLTAVPASAASRTCTEPGSSQLWTQATPAEAGMDGAKLQSAIDYATQNAAFGVRVFRNGCKVGADAAGAANQNVQFQSWSLAKSVTSLIFGRAMTMGYISPDDPLGSLVPEADRPHGSILLRDLLTATSGLAWNGFRDYNIFMLNRVQDGLTVGLAHKPGKYWEYSQSGPALVAEATERAVGQDFQAFAQRQLFGKLGIGAGSWRWGRDANGNTQGFFDLHMRPDDYGRLGELMRLGGVWRGKRLLSKRYVREALTATRRNGCHGFMIWLNSSRPCVGPRVVDRPVSDDYRSPGLPHDSFQYSGLLGQLVTVFPSQGIVTVRVGTDLTIAGGASWDDEFHRRVLNSIADDQTRFPKAALDAGAISRDDVDRGFFNSLTPDALEGLVPPPLPPAGPARARAAVVKWVNPRISRHGTVRVRVLCPPNWTAALPNRCIGKIRMRGAKQHRYEIPGHQTKRLSLRLKRAARKQLRTRGHLTRTIRLRNADALRGTKTRYQATVKAR